MSGMATKPSEAKTGGKGEPIRSRSKIRRRSSDSNRLDGDDGSSRDSSLSRNIPRYDPYSRHGFDWRERRANARVYRDTCDSDMDDSASDRDSFVTSSTLDKILSDTFGTDGEEVATFMKRIGKLRAGMKKLSRRFNKTDRGTTAAKRNQEDEPKPTTDITPATTTATASPDEKGTSSVSNVSTESTTPAEMKNDINDVGTVTGAEDAQDKVEASDGRKEQKNVETVQEDVEKKQEHNDKPHESSSQEEGETKVTNSEVAIDSDGPPRLEDSDAKPDVKDPIRKFELKFQSFYRGDSKSQRAYLSTNMYPFIRVKYLSHGENSTDPRSTEIHEIMIESPVFKDYFESLSDLAKEDPAPEESMLRFFKPFRWLIENADKFRDKINELEKDSSSLQPAKDDQTPQDIKSDEDPSGAEAKAADADIPDSQQHDTNVSKQSDSRSGPEFDLRTQLSFLSEFIDLHLTDYVTLYSAYREAKLPTVPFNQLWMLFRPGDIVYAPRRQAGPKPPVNNPNQQRAYLQKNGRSTPQAYKVISVTGGREFVGTDLADVGMSVAETHKALDIFVYYIDFDGSRLGSVGDHFVLNPYQGAREVTELQCYPLNYVSTKPLDEKSEPSSALEDLNARGEAFLNVCRVSHRLYEGLTVGADREEISTAVIIDFQTIYQAAPNWNLAPKFTTLNQEMLSTIFRHGAEVFEIVGRAIEPYEQRDLYFEGQLRRLTTSKAQFVDKVVEYPALDNPKTKIPELASTMREAGHLLLLPGVVYGFALRNRRWVHLDVRQVQKIHFEAEWNDLVLPPGHKEMVRAVVENHATGSRSTQKSPKGSLELDIVRGKGKGCIILLHGEPGVGKTSTAECVASYTEKPLFPITCGDIGYEPDEVEENLEKHFNLAHKWGCVMLLDEADVFLARRSREDVKRNGLVSVFLRTLEYYPGILFLTTNRVGAFDDAFRSRIHLSLYYPKLNRRQTILIWEMNLRRAAELGQRRALDGKPQLKIHEGNIMRFVKSRWQDLNWNGRQIRNAVQTAVALAEFDARDITPDDHEKKITDIKIPSSLDNDNTKPGKEKRKDNADDEDPTADAFEESNEEKKRSRQKQPVLSTKQFRTIAQASKDFDDYLFSTHGGDEAALARRDKSRWDYAVKERPFRSQHSDQQRHHTRDYTREKKRDKKRSKFNDSSSDSYDSSDSSGGSSDEDSEDGSETDASSDRESGRRASHKKRVDDGEDNSSTSEHGTSDLDSGEKERKSSRKSKKGSSNKKEKSRDQKKSKSRKGKDTGEKKAKSKSKKEKA